MEPIKLSIQTADQQRSTAWNSLLIETKRELLDTYNYVMPDVLIRAIRFKLQKYSARYMLGYVEFDDTSDYVRFMLTYG